VTLFIDRVFKGTSDGRHRNGTTSSPLAQGTSSLAGLILKAQGNFSRGCHEGSWAVGK